MNPSFFILFQQAHLRFLVHCSTAAFDKSWLFWNNWNGIGLQKKKQKKRPTIFVSRGASFAQKSPLLGVEIIQLDQNPPNQLNRDKY